MGGITAANPFLIINNPTRLAFDLQMLKVIAELTGRNGS